MRSFEIFLHPQPDTEVPTRKPGGRQGGARAMLDVFVRGANVTARVADGEAMSALADVARATLELSGMCAGKRIVHFHDEQCELCLERDGGQAYLSVYRTGQAPEVYVYDRELRFFEVFDGVRDALERVLEGREPASATQRKQPASAVRAELALLLGQLAEVEREDLADPDPEREAEPPTTARVEAQRDLPLAFSAELQLRARNYAPRSVREHGHSERSDAHALLVRGEVMADLAGRSLSLGTLHPFLFVETLLGLVGRLFDAWQKGRAAHERVDVGGMLVGARLAAPTTQRLGSKGPHSGAVALIFTSQGHTATYPGLSLHDVAEGVLAFGSSLSRALLRRDRTQGKNLRLSSFRRRLRQLRELLRDATPQDVVINQAPESYRAYAEHCVPKAASERPTRPAPTRLRYQAAWRAMVPGIDLGSTFLCGSRLLVGSAKETFCLDREHGEVIWQRPMARGASVVTPEGLVRVAHDGTLELHDWEHGEVILRTWSAPRAFAPPTGAVISGPGLPRLLVMTEGERHLVAIDLRSGEARWRYSWAPRGGVDQRSGDGGQIKLRRHGKLLYVTAGDGALTALDVVTGQVVWRMRDHLRFFVAPTVLQHEAFALAGGQAGKARVHALDPFSGELRWNAELSGQYPTTEGGVLCSRDTVMALRRERSGLVIEAFDRESGSPAWQTGVVAPTGTAWMVVDQRLVGNTPTGELVGIATDSGKTVYRTRFGRLPETDLPRRLEPVLRSGALFVPHGDVHVVRPEDGTVLGALGCKEVIPDLLRVDEHCSIYVAEESGHLGAYEARARLSLVG